MIEKLTPEQEAKLPLYRDEWIAIGLSTAPAAKEDAEQGLREAYEVAGLKPPAKVIWTSSPYEMLTYAAAVLKHDDCSPTKAQLDAITDEERRNQLGNAMFGQHDAHWLGFYEFFDKELGLEAPQKLRGLNKYARAANWCVPFENVAVCSDRPSELHRDDRGRLHNTQGPAIKFRDGWCKYFLHGIQVSEADVMKPMTVQRIESERNAEVRRVLIDLMGLENYVNASKFKKLGEDRFGVLLQKELRDDEPLTVVKVVNSTPEPDGTYKNYFLRVPPSIRTAKEGIAWTFNCTPEDYEPEVET